MLRGRIFFYMRLHAKDKHTKALSIKFLSLMRNQAYSFSYSFQRTTRKQKQKEIEVEDEINLYIVKQSKLPSNYFGNWWCPSLSRKCWNVNTTEYVHHHCTYSGFDNDKLKLEDVLDEKEFVGFRASASKSRKSSSSIEFCSHILLYLSKGKRSL